MNYSKTPDGEPNCRTSSNVILAPRHHPKQLSLAAALACLIVGSLVPSANGARTYLLTTNFDGTFGSTLTAPFIGTGEFIYEAGKSPLPDGSYDLTLFASYTITPP